MATDFKAVIPAAGGGTRLLPHTQTVPKVLLEVAGRPIIGHIVDRLQGVGPSEICVVLGRGGDDVEEYLRSAFDCRFSFVHQDEPLGLGHAVYQTRSRCQDAPILIALGDTIVEMDLGALVGPSNTIGTREVEDPRRFGVVELDGDRVRRIVEKPEVPPSRLAVVGVYFIHDSAGLYRSLERVVSDDRKTRGEYQLTDALQQMVEDGHDFRVMPVDTWLDCGTPDALLATNRYLLESAGRPAAREGTVFVPPVLVHDSAVVADCVIGPHVSVGAGAELRGSVIRNSIVGRQAVVEGAVLDASIVGESATVRGRARRLNLGPFSRMEADDD